MVTVPALTELLVWTLRDRQRRLEHVKRFQPMVWDNEGPIGAPEVDSALRDLAYDLDFFEPDERLRAEDRSFYGEARFEEEIRSVLDRIAPGVLDAFR